MNINYKLKPSEYANELYKFNKFIGLDIKVLRVFSKKDSLSFINIEINEIYMEIRENKSYISFPLTDVISLKENKDYICIITNLYYKFIIPKSAFETLEDINWFISTIKNSIIENDKSININKEIFIHNHKVFFTIILFLIPLFIGLIYGRFSVAIFWGAAFISFIYQLISLYILKKKFKLKKNIKIESFNLDNNLSSVLNETTTIEIDADDIKKLIYLRNNFYIQSNSLIFLNQCFFPEKKPKIKFLKNEMFKVKRRFFYGENHFGLYYFT